MRNYISGPLLALALATYPSFARAQTTTGADAELAFMPRTMTVTLLNEGGKYVAIDLKHIPEGGTCRMDKDATIFRVGHGAMEGTTRVRYAAPQISSGGCPFLTIFDLPTAEYAAARAAFVRRRRRPPRRSSSSRKTWVRSGTR